MFCAGLPYRRCRHALELGVKRTRVRAAGGKGKGTAPRAILNCPICHLKFFIYISNQVLGQAGRLSYVLSFLGQAGRLSYVFSVLGQAGRLSYVKPVLGQAGRLSYVKPILGQAKPTIQAIMPRFQVALLSLL